ncbi:MULTISPECIES: hypothetical protein [unclassified Streptomyces]
MLEIHIVASGDVAYPALMVIAGMFCCRKKLIKAVQRRIRGQK